ncbi:MAG: N-acetylmannosamine-6-phosphate 2-epimerase [Herpetosiphonaceae bacterium]|nr:N-acetylmannosamine-6-phosphate 2-epimerase [Herpetosiphonaceae bacterium]
MNMLPRGLIVSCQAYAGEPLFGDTIMAAMARAALEGGAVGIRANSPVDIAAIRLVTDRPIIGLYKIHSPDSAVYITPTCEAALTIANAGCDWIAIDATPRPRPGGVTLTALIHYIHTDLHKPVMADISCVADAELAASLGADVLSTTLAGYTEHGRPALDGPDFDLLEILIKQNTLPVIAEGRYREPGDVVRAFALGAHAVVIGGAITRPQDITRRLVRAIPMEGPA